VVALGVLAAAVLGTYENGWRGEIIAGVVLALAAISLKLIHMRSTFREGLPRPWRRPG
jgi:hypothetical protein